MRVPLRMICGSRNRATHHQNRVMSTVMAYGIAGPTVTLNAEADNVSDPTHTESMTTVTNAMTTYQERRRNRVTQSAAVLIVWEHGEAGASALLIVAVACIGDLL